MNGQPSHARAAVVTGAASGIGREVAVQLAARGWKLSLWDLDQVALDDVATELGGADVRALDVTSEQAVAAAARDARIELGSIDAVVHSAGVLHAGMFGDVALDQHRRMIKINLWGSVNVAHALLPALCDSGGALLMMGSASAFYGAPEFASYGATKAGVVALAEALRIEFEPQGVSVGTCNPLFVAGPMVANQRVEPRFVKREGLVHTPGQVAASVVRWVERPRGGFVWPSFAPRRIHLLSRYLAFAAHTLMARAWRKQRV